MNDPIPVVENNAGLRMEPIETRRFHFAGWMLDTTVRQLVTPAGVVVPLSGGEYRLLRVLLEHSNRSLSRDQLLHLTQGREAGPFDRSIDIQISRLRRRLGDNPRTATLIKTVRNQGYLLAASVRRET